MTAHQYALDLGRALADAGIATAAAHAEREVPGWTETVLADLAVYARTHGRFPLEQWRMDRAQFLPQPASANAWGSIGRAAVKRGIVRWSGEYVLAKSPATRSHPVRVLEAA